MFHLKGRHVGWMRRKFLPQFRQSSTYESSLILLKLPRTFSITDLRDSYFHQAKLCHPDLNMTKSHDELSEKFIQITDAYEMLQRHKKGDDEPGTNEQTDMSNIVTFTEEQNYRAACRDSLGLNAETVEESKKCPLFREWLKGKTDAAFTWNNFFMLNGGLAPMLSKKKKLSLTGGKDEEKRRRRKRIN